MTFSLNNIFQAKTMVDGKEKKLELFSWRMNTSYNFANDNFPLANLSSSVRAKIANKLNLDLSLSHDFYKFNNENGQRINSININENGIPTPRLINARLSTGFRFQGNRIGYVSRVNKTLNSNSQNMSVFIESNENDLYNGMYVYGEIIVGEAENTFLIKRNLINEDEVFLIVDNKLISKKIDIIQITEENAIIRGLSENDRILSESIKGSYSGMEVRFKD